MSENRMVKFNHGDWKLEKGTTRFQHSLKIKGTGIRIGYIGRSYDDESKLRVYSRFGSVAGKSVEIPYTEDFSIIHKVWEEISLDLINRLILINN